MHLLVVCFSAFPIFRHSFPNIQLIFSFFLSTRFIVAALADGCCSLVPSNVFSFSCLLVLVKLSYRVCSLIFSVFVSVYFHITSYIFFVFLFINTFWDSLGQNGSGNRLEELTKTNRKKNILIREAEFWFSLARGF